MAYRPSHRSRRLACGVAASGQGVGKRRVLGVVPDEPEGGLANRHTSLEFDSAVGPQAPLWPTKHCPSGTRRPQGSHRVAASSQHAHASHHAAAEVMPRVKD